MAYVNVNRKNTDQFYRYKMPKLIAKVRHFGYESIFKRLIWSSEYYHISYSGRANFF